MSPNLLGPASGADTKSPDRLLGFSEQGDWESSNAAAYDVLAPLYDDQVLASPFYQNESDRISRLIVAHEKTATRDVRALDIGCGTGIHVALMSSLGWDVTAIDVSPMMLQSTEAKLRAQKLNARLIQMSAHSLDQLDGPYDFVLAAGSIVNHLTDWAAFFLGVKNLLAPHGKFVFTMDNQFGLDYLAFAAYSMLLRKQFKATAAEVLSSLRTAFRGGVSTNEWPLVSESGVQKIHLVYHPEKNVRAELHRTGLSIERTEGINLLPTLIPQVALSEVYPQRLRPGSLLYRVLRLAIRADAVITRIHRVRNMAGIYVFQVSPIHDT